MRVPADEFNRGAERYYRNGLRRRHIVEGLAIFEEDFLALDLAAARGDELERCVLGTSAPSGAAPFLTQVREDVVAERLDLERITKLLNLALLTVNRDQAESHAYLQRRIKHAGHAAPVYRAG